MVTLILPAGSTLQEYSAEYLRGRLTECSSTRRAVAELLVALKKCSRAFNGDTVPLNDHPFTRSRADMVHMIADACGLPPDNQPWPRMFNVECDHRAWLLDTFYGPDSLSLEQAESILEICLERGRRWREGCSSEVIAVIEHRSEGSGDPKHETALA